MAKKAAKKSTKRTNGKPKRASKKKPAQNPLPGMEDKGIPTLDKIAVKALDAKGQQKEWKEKHDGFLHGLLVQMRKLNMNRYRHGGIEVERQPGDETVKVKRVKEKRAV